MARQTFQALLRTTAGRASSAIHRETGDIRPVMRMTVPGYIQMVAPADLGVGTRVLGMLPAFWVPVSARLVTAHDAGTIDIVLPAYDGLAEVTLASIAHNAGTGELSLDAGEGVSYGIDRPVQLEGSVSVEGLSVVALFGFPLDDGYVSGD